MSSQSQPEIDPAALLGLSADDPRVTAFMERYGLVRRTHPGAAPWLSGEGVSVGLSMDGTTITSFQFTGPDNATVISAWMNHGAWAGILPFGLDFTYSREDVWTQLGVPAVVAGAEGQHTDRYFIGEAVLLVCFHAEFPRIWMVHLIPASRAAEPESSVPGKSLVH